jgi:hypothetical protein
MAAALSQFLQDNLEPFLQKHKLTQHQLKTLKSYRACRTNSLGGHSQYCQNGHLMGVWYNSCKRRGCPSCQALSNARWLAAQRSRLLAVTHHHWIFTLPHELLPLWRFNRERFQDLIFQSVSATLKVLGRDKQYLNAQSAYMLTLHTWGRNLSLHPHIHCLIAHGGLDQQGRWIEPKKRCLFPAKVMMALFRGKLLSALRKEADLSIPTGTTTSQCRDLLYKLGKKAWVVHCCKPYAHGNGVATYLSRYVKSGAFKNSQITRTNTTDITFAYQSHQTGKRSRQKMTSEQFIYRICEHIAQRKKANIRYYGLYHGSCREALNRAREQLGQEIVEEPEEIGWLDYLQTLDRTPVCEVCQAPLQTTSIKSC